MKTIKITTIHEYISNKTAKYILTFNFDFYRNKQCSYHYVCFSESGDGRRESCIGQWSVKLKKQ